MSQCYVVHVKVNVAVEFYFDDSQHQLFNSGNFELS